MHSITFTIDQLQELQLALSGRIVEVKSTLNHKNETVAAISKRQLDRLTPMMDVVDSIISNHFVHQSKG